MKLIFNIHMISHGTYDSYFIPYVLMWNNMKTKPTPRWTFVHASNYNKLLKQL